MIEINQLVVKLLKQTKLVDVTTSNDIDNGGSGERRVYGRCAGSMPFSGGFGASD
jgi:hypothetical protein